MLNSYCFRPDGQAYVRTTVRLSVFCSHRQFQLFAFEGKSHKISEVLTEMAFQLHSQMDNATAEHTDGVRVNAPIYAIEWR